MVQVAAGFNHTVLLDEDGVGTADFSLILHTTLPALASLVRPRGCLNIPCMRGLLLRCVVSCISKVVWTTGKNAHGQLGLAGGGFRRRTCGRTSMVL